MTRHLPNFLTICNLLCGCVGIYFAFTGSLTSAAVMVWAACIFDFLDGFAARQLGVSSPIGKELDSLADMVTFGTLPAFVMFQLMLPVSTVSWLPFLAFAIAAFSALRLAKFNIDERQHDSFIGLPTPANALFITSLIFLGEPLNTILSSSYWLAAITLLFSFLLVSPFELFALKFKDFSWQHNKVRFTFLLVAVLLIIGWQASALPMIILGYVLVSLLSRWV